MLFASAPVYIMSAFMLGNVVSSVLSNNMCSPGESVFVVPAPRLMAILPLSLRMVHPDRVTDAAPMFLSSIHSSAVFAAVPIHATSLNIMGPHVGCAYERAHDGVD